MKLEALNIENNSTNHLNEKSTNIYAREKGEPSLKKQHEKAIIIISITTLLLLNMSGAFFNILTVSGSTVRKVPDPYPTIQAAINAANPGDIIEVAAGTYYEHIVVPKSLTLKGDNRLSIIDGQKTPPMIVNITASYVTMSGFTVQNGGAYMGIQVQGTITKVLKGIVISENALINDYIGVYLTFCNGAIISKNTFNTNYYGIRLHESDSCTIECNRINGTKYYAFNLYAHSNLNKVLNNTMTYNKYCVLIEWSDENTLSFNTLSSNTEYAIRLSYSTKILVKGNNIMKNKYGVFVWNCSGNTFYYNNFIDNTIQVDKYDANLKQNLWDTNISPGTEGNYWSDYTGVDDGSGVGRWGEPRVADDGIGDTKVPHSQVVGVSWFGLDWYPLMHPWTPVPSPWPVAIFTHYPPEPIVNLVTTFNASKSYDRDGFIVSYKWDFGDGTIVTESDPIRTHVYTKAGNVTVTLTVTDDDGLYNSTSKVITVLLYRLVIDVYTQKEPYSGRGPNQPSDAFAPQDRVFLYAEVTYNYELVQNKPVRFVVIDPKGELMVDRSSFTNEVGIAEINFTLPTTPVFGTHTVLATVSVAEKNASDTLTFEVGWIIEIINVETVDEHGNPKNSFVRGEHICFDILLKNIAFTPRTGMLTISILDERNVTIGAAGLSVEVSPGTREFNLLFNLAIPEWSFVGSATAIACIFTDWPWKGGTPYGPEASTSFYIMRV